MFAIRRYLVGWILVLLTVLPAQAQDGGRESVTLADLYTRGVYVAAQFGPARWLSGGTAYTTLEPSAAVPFGTDIVQYDAETGERTVLVPAERLIPEGLDRPIAIDDYAWGPNGRYVLIFTNSERVWRLKTRGDYYLLDLRSRAMRRIGREMPASSLMFAKLAPDGKSVAYVVANNLYVEGLHDGRITQLTIDGSDTIINGTFDWVYEEELHLRDGFRWSPDGRRIAFWQMDTSGVRDFYLINNTDSIYSQVIPIQYPKAGTTNSAARVGVVSVAGGDVSWFQPSTDPRNNYIARMDWAANSTQIVLQRMNRQQNTLDIIMGDVRSGEMQSIMSEKDSAWVEFQIRGEGNIRAENLFWLEKGRSFTWVSERDGWRHAYRVNRDGSDAKLITKGPFDITGVVHVDSRRGWFYFLASPDNPAQRFLYRARLDGTGASERITPLEAGGTHTYNVSPSGDWAIHSHASFGSPAVTDLIRLPGHEFVRMLEDNAVLYDRLNGLARGTSRFFRLDVGDDLQLDGWEMRPPNFDPARKYPVLYFVYGEPGRQTVRDRWVGSYYLWHLMLTQQGYVVISIDSRGTPAPRGRDWRKVVYGSLGPLATRDQASAARAINRWSYVDSTRIGIWGWSGGGSMSLNAIFRHPDVYHTAMAVAPLPDQRYYDTIYQERYMGLPQDNPQGYLQGSPINFAHQLEGNLLLVHGTGDDNVHYQGTEALVNRLVAHNKPFTMMAYPNRTHSIAEGRNTRRHLFELLTRYLHESLPAGPR